MPDNKYSAEPWIGTKEIAEHLGVTVVTVRKWIASDKIPCHRVGKLWKFKASEVDEWVLGGGAAEDCLTESSNIANTKIHQDARSN